MKYFARLELVLIVFVVSLGGGCAHKTSAGTSLRPPAKFRAFVGTYTSGKSQGIYTFSFDSNTGKVGTLELAAPALNPSFLAIHPDHQHLYCVGDMTNALGQKVGAVGAYAIGEAGKLTLLNQVPTVGAGPCHLAVDKTGRMVLAANYGGGSVVSFPINADGSVGEHACFAQHTDEGGSTAKVQPHAHSVTISADNRFAFVADLGLNQVLTYRLDPANATFAPHEPPFVKVAPGSGPRHFCFHPSGKFAYVINELAMTVTAFKFDADRGVLTAIQTVSTLPSAAGSTPKPGWSTAEVLVHPNGKFLLGSNRGHDTIAVFTIARNGTLKLVRNTAAEVKVPRNIALDPTGQWLFAEGQKSDDIAVFRVNSVTGEIDFTGGKISVGSPVCLKFLPLP